MRLEQPKSSYSAYVKASFVFAASTAAFLLAKTTVFLPKWSWSEGDDNIQGLALSEEKPGASLMKTMLSVTDSTQAIPIVEMPKDLLNHPPMLKLPLGKTYGYH